MNRKVYEWQCLLRRPEFRADLGRLLAENPKVKALYLWKATGQGTPSGLGPDEPQLKALQAFKAKYPAFDDPAEIHVILQPYPLVFDPAWQAAVAQAQVQFIKRKGSAARGLVTRTGVEADDGGTDAEEVHQSAREIFDHMGEILQRLWRQQDAPAVFRNVRVCFPIGPETTLEQVKRLWPIVQRAQRTCYGELPARRATRRGLYQQRVQAWDLVRDEGLSLKEAARRAVLPLWTFCRRYYEAVRDVEGVEGKLSPEAFANHLATCATCQGAEAGGKSDRFCPWMQRQLGPRSSRIKGAQYSGTKEGRSALESEESKRARGWRDTS